MTCPHAPDPRRAAIRAEMRELRIGRRAPYPSLALGLIATADAASAILMLAGL